MHWQDIRGLYPQRWLLLEALEAHSEGGRRLLDSLAVIDAFDDSRTALAGYQILHKQAPQRELYVLHTSREQPDIRERHSRVPKLLLGNPVQEALASCTLIGNLM